MCWRRYIRAIHAHAHAHTHAHTIYIRMYIHIIYTYIYTCIPVHKVCMSLPCTTQDFYQEGEYIIHQGGIGDTFFIINVGSVSQW